LGKDSIDCIWSKHYDISANFSGCVGDGDEAGRGKNHHFHQLVSQPSGERNKIANHLL